MLDMGFIHDVRRVIALLPRHRQTLFFSATMPREAQELADQLLRDPRDRRGRAAGDHRREGRPGGLLRREGRQARAAGRRAARRRRCAARSCSRAPSTAPTGSPSTSRSAGIGAEAIHGNKSQNARERALAGFKAGTHARARRDRHRRARHRHRRHHARHQLRPARRARDATSTASAAPRAPAPPGWRCRSATPRSAPTCARSRSSPARTDPGRRGPPVRVARAGRGDAVGTSAGARAARPRPRRSASPRRRRRRRRAAWGRGRARAQRRRPLTE